MINVLHYVAVMDRGGQETFIMNLYRKIDRNQIQFDFLCGEERSGAYDDEIKTLGGKIFHLKPRTAPNPLNHLQEVRALARFLRKSETKYDVFHIHTHHAFSAFLSVVGAKLAGIKTIVVHSHNTSAQYHLKAHELFKKLLCCFKIKRFACSEAAGFWLHGKKDFKVIHNGVDLDVFRFDADKRDDIRQELKWGDKKIIGHIGRFNGQKNHTFLIEIFEALHLKEPNTHLVLVGKGELEDEIRKLVSEKQLNDAVTFLGVRDDVHRLYQGMDLFLFPSLFEGLSVVLVEAQTCGLPCLISDTITPENVFVDNVIQKSLKDSAKEWSLVGAQMLIDYAERSDTTNVIRKYGYDMGDLAAKLYDIYMN